MDKKTNPFKWVVLSSLMGFSAQGEAAVQQLIKIENIRIETQNKELKNNLETFLRFYRGRASSQETINDIRSKAVDYLLDRKYLQAVLEGPVIKILKNHSSVLSYKITHPIQYRIIIRGNEQVRTSTLYKIINKESLLNHPHFTDIIQNRIIEYYKSSAFNSVQLKLSLTKSSKYVHYLRINVKEGRLFVIQDLKISGITDKNSGRYLNLFKTYASDSLRSNYYVEKDFESALKKVVIHLRKRGFYNAVVYHKNIFYKKNKVFIEVILNEQTPLAIKKIEIKGNRQLSRKNIQNIIGLKPGDRLDIPKLEENVRKVIQKYFEKGFLKAEIDEKNLVKILRSEKSAVITIYISEGQKVYAKNIKVKGNQKISSDFIIHASSLKEDDILTYRKIRQSMDFIEDLGLFTRVNIRPSSEDSIAISVQENKFNSLRFKLGANTEHTLSGRVFAELNTKNIFNNNNSQSLLSISTQPNYRLFKNIFSLPSNQWKILTQSIGQYLPYSLSGSYKRYYILGSRWSGQMSYSYANSIFSFVKIPSSENTEMSYLDSSEKAEWLKSHKFSFNLERKFDLNTLLNFKIWEVDLRSSHTQRFLLHRDKTHSAMTFNFEEQTIVAETGLEVRVDRRDNRFFPKKGFQLESTIDYSSPYIGAHEDIHFIRTEIRHTYYSPIFTTNTIFAQSINGGVVYRINSGQVPVDRLFILGGAGSLRGYNGEYMGDSAQRVPSVNDFPIENAVENKSYSSAYVLVKNEVRIPMDRRLGFTLFYDGGLVFLRKTKIETYYGHSAGVGLYGLTPLGIPAVINVGYRLDPNAHPKDGEGRPIHTIHTDFSIGFF